MPDPYVQGLTDTIDGLEYSVEDLTKGLLASGRIDDAKANQLRNPNFRNVYGFVQRGSAYEMAQLLKAVRERLIELRGEDE
jgi:hypothetical protein